ncbi:MAG TPA: effector-associated domain EAD1-containing protein, partial [Thermoanaerobaculia bacterium]|nr:effector-associated domain EAD1-containing protein [Thermoanaerobaculia bacterium]
MGSPSLKQLVDIFVRLYSSPQDALDVARLAELPPHRISLGGNAMNVWVSILGEAAKHKDGVARLIDVAKEQYPDARFPVLPRDNDAPIAQGPEIPDSAWRGLPDGTAGLEKVMGKQPTFLPISFLETGALRARAVVRIVCPNGLGSGFLIGDNLVVTNHHVLPSVEIARQARVQFNYQLTP